MAKWSSKIFIIVSPAFVSCEAQNCQSQLQKIEIRHTVNREQNKIYRSLEDSNKEFNSRRLENINESKLLIATWLFQIFGQRDCSSMV